MRAGTAGSLPGWVRAGTDTATVAAGRTGRTRRATTGTATTDRHTTRALDVALRAATGWYAGAGGAPGRAGAGGVRGRGGHRRTRRWRDGLIGPDRCSRRACRRATRRPTRSSRTGPPRRRTRIGRFGADRWDGGAGTAGRLVGRAAGHRHGGVGVWRATGLPQPFARPLRTRVAGVVRRRATSGPRRLGRGAGFGRPVGSGPPATRRGAARRVRRAAGHGRARQVRRVSAARHHRRAVRFRGGPAATRRGHDALRRGAAAGAGDGAGAGRNVVRPGPAARARHGPDAGRYVVRSRATGPAGDRLDAGGVVGPGPAAAGRRGDGRVGRGLVRALRHAGAVPAARCRGPVLAVDGRAARLGGYPAGWRPGGRAGRRRDAGDRRLLAGGAVRAPAGGCSRRTTGLGHAGPGAVDGRARRAALGTAGAHRRRGRAELVGTAPGHRRTRTGPAAGHRGRRVSRAAGWHLRTGPGGARVRCGTPGDRWYVRAGPDVTGPGRSSAAHARRGRRAATTGNGRLRRVGAAVRHRPGRLGTAGGRGGGRRRTGPAGRRRSRRAGPTGDGWLRTRVTGQGRLRARVTGRGRLRTRPAGWLRARRRGPRSGPGGHPRPGGRRRHAGPGGRARCCSRPARRGRGGIPLRSEFAALLLGGTQIVDPAEFLADDGRVELGLGPAASPPAALGPRIAPLVGAVRRPLRTTRHHY